MLTSNVSKSQKWRSIFVFIFSKTMAIVMPPFQTPHSTMSPSTPFPFIIWMALTAKFWWLPFVMVQGLYMPLSCLSDSLLNWAPIRDLSKPPLIVMFNLWVHARLSCMNVIQHNEIRARTPRPLITKRPLAFIECSKYTTIADTLRIVNILVSGIFDGCFSQRLAWDHTSVQPADIGWPTGNGKKLSKSQACCLAQLCLGAAYFLSISCGQSCVCRL